MKKSKVMLSGVLSTSIIISSILGTVTANAASNIKIVINNKPATFQVDPEIVDGRILVPLNAISTQMGGGAEWDEKEKKITVSLDNRYAILYVGSNVMTYGLLRADNEGRLVYSSKETMELPIAPTIVNGATLVPIEAISEALGATVGWDPNTMTLTVLSSKHVPSPTATANPSVVAPTTTPKPEVKPVFQDTQNFQEVSGHRLQEMRDLNKDFAFIYYDSKSSNASEAVKTIKEFADKVGAKIYGFDVSTVKFTSNSKLKFINDFEWDKSRPTLFMSYSGKEVEIEQDFTDKDLIIKKLDNILNTNYPTPLPTTTPEPESTPEPKESTKENYNFKMIDMDEATRMRDRGDSFIYVLYDSGDDEEIYDRNLESVYEAAKEAKVKVYATDLNKYDKKTPKDWMTSLAGGYVTNPTLFFVTRNGAESSDLKPNNVSWIRMTMETFDSNYSSNNYWY